MPLSPPSAAAPAGRLVLGGRPWTIWPAAASEHAGTGAGRDPGADEALAGGEGYTAPGGALWRASGA